MVKIVINRCFGGFGLSTKATKEYYKRKYGKELFAYKQTSYSFEGGEDVYSQSPEDCDASFVHYSPVNKPELTSKEINEDYFYEGDIERTDPVLIEIVREMGEKANGGCAELEIVCVPDGVDWEIEEYDGNEWVSEKHQRW